ncbi:hypothetical protein KDJ56_12500 [Brevibacillus composti]|uniref:Uncharacterized protein n=1 Tax=Brevibacillus composti TaxID=2796470 RepID=A0A7T5JM62_9BACL|nr:hypothetical protein [Brevibacillus composti]QQE72779.1 hypothetical protein JD108_12555 [Brevibacillus composti]QUO39858.1 hypothetical protein KDJ56_12500 [Brevibacillus composti]
MADDFDRQFTRFSRRMEKGMILAIVLCACLLMAGEMLLSFEPLRSTLVETERLEGVMHRP